MTRPWHGILPPPRGLGYYPDEEAPVYMPLFAHHTIDYANCPGIGQPRFKFDFSGDIAYNFDLKPYIDEAMHQIESAVRIATIEHLITALEAKGYTVTPPKEES